VASIIGSTKRSMTPRSAPPEGPIRALLVEPRAAEAKRLAGMLAKAGPQAVELVTVDQMGEALLRLAKESFEVVLVDRRLPDGLGALDQVDQLAPDAAVVVLSGHGDQAITWQVVDHGAQEFVLGGNRGEQLLSTIRQAIARKHAELRLTRMALRDPLTGLANRLLLHERLERACLRAHRDERSFGILFVDLDGFKLVNDSLGHDLGDHLLRAVARRLESLVRRVDTVARWGGDEFVVLVEGFNRSADAALIAEKALTTLVQPFEIRGHELHIGASIGISLYPEDTTDLEALVRYADHAMYRAKHAGCNRFRFHAEMAPDQPDTPPQATPPAAERRPD
jgi:diguanylate cyclase (GGDEF)-like protein